MSAASRSLVISGRSGAGKTTAVLQLLRERAADAVICNIAPDCGPDEWMLLTGIINDVVDRCSLAVAFVIDGIEYTFPNPVVVRSLFRYLRSRAQRGPRILPQIVLTHGTPETPESADWYDDVLRPYRDLVHRSLDAVDTSFYGDVLLAYERAGVVVRDRDSPAYSCEQ